MTQYALDVAGLSDQGIKRDHNEDAWSGPPADLAPEQRATKGLLYIVADGVGGHQAGDVASAMATEIIPRHYYADPAPDVVSSLTAAIQEANRVIYHEAEAKSEQFGMGTTVTAVVLCDGALTVANVGDSRTYLIRDGQARQVTTDHTWVEEQVQVGIITREEAARHPHRNIITRSLGGQPGLQIDIFEEQVGPRDSVLLCSDGLSNMVPDSEIGAVVSQGKNATLIVHELVELAKERGAPDNVTTVLLNIKHPHRGFRRWLAACGTIGGLLLVIGALAMGALLKADKDEPSSSLTPTLEPPSPTATSLPAAVSASPTATLVPTIEPSTPTATPLPLDTAIPTPELVLPDQDAAIVAGSVLLFSWKWEQELEGEGWRFLFDIWNARDAPALAHEELPINQRGHELSQPLDPGEYWWTVAVAGSNRQGEAAERRLTIVEPTPIPNSQN